MRDANYSKLTWSPAAATSRVNYERARLDRDSWKTGDVDVLENWKRPAARADRLAVGWPCVDGWRIDRSAGFTDVCLLCRRVVGKPILLSPSIVLTGTGSRVPVSLACAAR